MAEMQDWMRDFLNRLFTPGFNGHASCNCDTQAQEAKKQEFYSGIPKGKKKLIYGIGENSIPYEIALRVTTYTEIQEGKFEEIESETGEMTVINTEENT